MTKLTEEARQRYATHVESVHSTLLEVAECRMQRNTPHEIKSIIIKSRNLLYNFGYTKYVIGLDATNYYRIKSDEHRKSNGKRKRVVRTARRTTSNKNALPRI